MIKVRKTQIFSKWLGSINDPRSKGKIAARIDRLTFGNPGDVKPDGQGVSELRIHYGAGYRVYFLQKSSEAIVILCGGNKSTQSRDIKLAKELAEKLPVKPGDLTTWH